MAEHGYSDFDRQRFLAEDRRPGTARGEFTRDRARVLHSAALRRLGAKTQVLSPANGGNNDFARTRLTHSLEVAQIGREMASDLGLDPDVVDLACLAHDLGHPPFGHNGEKALNQWALDFGGFEGNAQTLRLLSRIEPKVYGTDGRSFGLNLTRAALDASVKYPWSRDDAQLANPGEIDLKFGYYTDDKPVFDWIRIGAEPGIKCVEAQVMDFSDDVAYSVHDFEDAVVSGYIVLEELENSANENEIIGKVFDWAGGKFTHLQLKQALQRIRQNPYWSGSFDATPAAHGRLKNLTSSLIGSFVQRTTAASFAWAQEGEISRYNSQLQVPQEVAEEIAVLKGTVAAFLMTHSSRRPVYEWQRALLTELADALLAANGMHLDSFASVAWQQASTDEARHRAVVDHIACLTDQSAISLHHKLVTVGAK